MAGALSDLMSVSQVYLVPASILFGALGVAPTEQLKTLISLLGLVTSGIWLFRISVWTGVDNIDWLTTVALAGVFVLSWLVSLCAHARNWYLQALRDAIKGANVPGPKS